MCEERGLGLGEGGKEKSLQVRRPGLRARGVQGAAVAAAAAAPSIRGGGEEKQLPLSASLPSSLCLGKQQQPPLRPLPRQPLPLSLVSSHPSPASPGRGSHV